MAKEILYRNLGELKKLPNNPRTIKKDDMERLKKSIKDNPDYFEARPIILSNRTGELVILAGNQRCEAAKALGMDKVPTFLLEGLTEAREREIIIRDNVSNGDWDMDALANEWDEKELTEWGVEINWEELEQETIASLDDDTFLTSCYTKKQDIEHVHYSEAISKDDRYESLKKDVEKCQNEELKKILQKRLNDFVDFNFDYLADYYLSGASDDEKELMVELGLVIPTEKEAFINKFLDLEREIIVG